MWEGKLGMEAPRGAFVGPARERADDQPAEGRNKEEREGGGNLRAPRFA